MRLGSTSPLRVSSAVGSGVPSLPSPPPRPPATLPRPAAPPPAEAEADVAMLSLTWRVAHAALLAQQCKHGAHVDQRLLGLSVHGTQEVEGHGELHACRCACTKRGMRRQGRQACVARKPKGYAGSLSARDDSAGTKRYLPPPSPLHSATFSPSSTDPHPHPTPHTPHPHTWKSRPLTMTKSPTVSSPADTPCAHTQAHTTEVNAAGSHIASASTPP